MADIIVCIVISIISISHAYTGWVVPAYETPSPNSIQRPFSIQALFNRASTMVGTRLNYYNAILHGSFSANCNLKQIRLKGLDWWDGCVPQHLHVLP